MKKGKTILITFIAALGGFLFGFDTAVISGTIPFIKSYFELNELMLGWAVGCVIIGCMIGAFISGGLSDLFGRKKVLIFTAVLFTISALGTALTETFLVFILFRLIGGIGVGAASVLSPTYIAEISPAPLRGRLVSLNQLTIVIGILLAYFSNYFLLNIGDDNWRFMLGVEAIPAGLFLIALYWVPESPRWLVKANKNEQAKKVLNSFQDKDMADQAYQEIHKSLQEDQLKDSRIRWQELFKGSMKKIMVIGILLACFQQVTGINSIIYYAPTIFEKTGIGTDSALLQSVLVGTVNLLFTFVAIALIDKIGRKVLMLWGSAGMALSLGYLVFAFLTDNLTGYGVLIAVLAYIASFASSLAPVMWVVTSEIYPNRLRGAAMSLSTAASWTCTYLVVQTFPYLLDVLGGAYAFGVYGVLSMITFWFIKVYVPETKGKSLEQIEKELNHA